MLIGARLYFIQVQSAPYYLKQAQANQSSAAKEQVFQRGEIFMEGELGNLVPLAINKKWYEVYAVPQKIKPDKVEELSKKLALILGMKPETILQRLNKPNDPYEPLKDGLTEQEVEALRAQVDSPGIQIAARWGRFYPLQELAAHTVGFVGFKDNQRQGQYGLEEYWDEELSGRPTLLRGTFDAFGHFIHWAAGSLTGVRQGADLILSLDANISLAAQDILKKLVKKWDAVSGQIVVIDPRTGFLKAMVAYPSFDPNRYSQYPLKSYLSPFYQLSFEPGSVFKPITFAAALEVGAISPNETFQDPGQVKIGGKTIRNFDGRSHGTVTMTRVLELSLNTGAIYVQNKIGPQVFKNYLKKFGFGKKTGIRLAGEVGGDISNLDTGRPINFATASFGQGISVTELQLVQAMSAIANGGYLYRPKLVRQIRFPDGSKKDFQPEKLEKVISSKTASQLTAMLVSVVENGFGRKASIPGYWVAGKTGTAQVARPDAPGYLEGKTIHTFLGFAPAYDPVFLALIKLDEPKGIRFASDSVAPAFAELGKFILNYYQIPPSRKQNSEQ